MVNFKVVGVSNSDIVELLCYCYSGVEVICFYSDGMVMFVILCFIVSE